MSDTSESLANVPVVELSEKERLIVALLSDLCLGEAKALRGGQLLPTDLRLVRKVALEKRNIEVALNTADDGRVPFDKEEVVVLLGLLNDRQCDERDLRKALELPVFTQKEKDDIVADWIFNNERLDWLKDFDELLSLPGKVAVLSKAIQAGNWHWAACEARRLGGETLATLFAEFTNTAVKEENFSMAVTLCRKAQLPLSEQAFLGFVALAKGRVDPDLFINAHTISNRIPQKPEVEEMFRIALSSGCRDLGAIKALLRILEREMTEAEANSLVALFAKGKIESEYLCHYCSCAIELREKLTPETKASFLAMVVGTGRVDYAMSVAKELIGRELLESELKAIREIKQGKKNE